MDRYIKIRKEFEEIYYRRNLFVHNNGFVNKLYISKIDNKFSKDIKVGQKLICDDIYLDNAILVLKKVIISLHCEMLKCLEATQEDYDCIAHYGFEALGKEQYSLAEFLYGLLRKNKSFEFEHKITYELNYINSLKQQGKDINALTNAIDVSIAVDKYKIAKACLLNEDAMVYELLSTSYPDSFCASMIREWPIFINFRETEYYRKFVNEHKDDFAIFEFEENL